MRIPLITYLQIPLQYFQNLPSKIQQNWREKFGPFFKNLQESIAKNIPFRRVATVPEVPNGTAVKTDDLATKTLLPETAAKSPEATVAINLQQVLPLDPKTTVKKLDNGFTYYIRDHAYPSKETASLRLVVRTGSTDEQEQEQGIAHFLEHLLFQETDHYGKGELKRYLESKGAFFGADQNAHTSYNETVYKFDIPLNDPEVLDKTLHILREMATKAKITDSSVEEERPVILDEISEERAIHRYAKKRDTVLFEGTPYPHRKAAGLPKVIRECTPDQIRAFYQRTYLPQNMALVAVGDFDPKQVEELIQKHFNDIPLSSAPPIIHHFYPVERKEPQFICHADPESTTSLLQLHFPLRTDFEAHEVTLESMLQGIINSFYHLMFNKRLQEIVSDSESPPFIFARGSKDELVDNLFYYRLSLVSNDGEIPDAYKRLLLELKRVQEYGFLPEEFESAKKTYKVQLEHLEKEKNHMSTKGLANSYVSHFSDGNPYVDTAKSLELKKILLNFVKPEHVNLWNKVLTSNKGTVISTYLPASIENTVSPDILKKIGEEVTAATVTPYVNTIVDRPLLRQVPQAGKIVETATFEKVGVTKWTLENGMNVYIRPSTQKEDSILIYATSIGGELSVPYEKRATADMAVDLYSRSGLAGLTPTQLKKVLEGTTIGGKVLIGNYLTSFVTVSSKKDLETAFQVLYSSYADRTFRKEAFNTIKKEILNAVKHQDNNPETIFHRLETDLCTQNHPMFQPITAAEYEKAEYQDTVDFLNSQFQNPTNFNLVITGNINPEETKQLVEKYLAGLPSQGKKADFNSFKYPGYEYPNGIVVKEVEAGLTSQCQTHISFPAPAEDTKESRQMGAWTASLLGMHLTDRLRFVKAENYSVDCDYSLTTLPGQEKTDSSSMELEISGLPENIRDLNGIVLKEIERLQTEGFTPEELTSFHAQVKENYRKQIDLDSVWMSLIAFNARWGWDINTMTEDFYRTLEGFDEKVAQEYLKKLFPLNRYVQVTLFPKKAAANLELNDIKI